MAEKEPKNKKLQSLLVKLAGVDVVVEEHQKEIDLILHKCYDLVHHCLNEKVSKDPMMIGAAFMTAARQMYLDTVGPEQTQQLFQVFTDQVTGHNNYTIH